MKYSTGGAQRSLPQGPLPRPGILHNPGVSVEPHRGPPLEVIPRPAGVPGGCEGNPRGVHGARELLRRVVSQQRAEERRVRGSRVEDKRNLEGVDRAEARRGPGELVHVGARARVGVGVRVGQAYRGDPHPPVRLDRRQQITGSRLRVPRPVGGQRLVRPAARRPPGTDSRRRGPARSGSRR